MAVVETHLADAARRVRRERRRSLDELQAFRTFRSAVADVHPTAGGGRGGGPLATKTLGRSGASPSLTAIRREYERTVMAVSHYEEEYGDGYEESVAAEFGEDVAAALTGAGPGSLTPNLRQALVAGATAAMDERDEFCSLLDEESESVETVRAAVESADETLRSLDDAPLSDRSFAELVRLRESVVAVRDRLDEVAADRQATLQGHRRRLRGYVPDVTAYLYAPLAVEYPALDALGRLRDVVEMALTRVDSHLIASL
jgi:hypothetical protein